MGRKPNAITIAFFERGPKLNDSSNRYEHTCKSCGEVFPKGRTDSLMNHLLKKCSVIDPQTRHRIVCELNNIPMDSPGPSRSRNDDVQMNGPTVNLPIGSRNYRNLTALETLAEVARQTDSSEKKPQDGIRSDGRTAEQQQASRLELQEQYTLDNPPVSYEQRPSRDKRGLNGKAPIREGDASATHLSLHQPVSRSTSPNLAMAASSMAAAAAAAAFVPSMLDPQLLADDHNREHSVDVRPTQDVNEVNSALPEHFFDNNDHHSDWPMADGLNGNLYSDPNMAQMNAQNNPSLHTPYPPLAMNTVITTTFTAEYGNGQKAPKPKNRARFEPERKKQVSMLRNKGACIRCRMLRKPCSMGDPCDTCKSVESARLWKGPCVRAKLADELKMFSATLHNALSRRDVDRFKERAQFTLSAYQIEASHHPETGLFVVFNTSEAQLNPSSESIDPGLSGDFTTTTRTLRLLDETDDLYSKLEAYTKRMAPIFYQEEPSRFMNVTLITASQIATSKEDNLLTRALEFWSMVHILIDHNIQWDMKVIDITAQRGDGEKTTPSMGEKEIVGQLNSTAEKKADTMSKSLLRELEKRLVASPPHAKFELFLATMIILNCVEKATWLFKCWEQDDFQPQWPLMFSPTQYATQGEKLTNIIHNMLKMRNIIPQATVGDNGVLVAVEGSEPAFVDYFNALGLSHADVLLKQANPRFDVTDSRCFELRFCSKVLLSSSS